MCGVRLKSLNLHASDYRKVEKAPMEKIDRYLGIKIMGSGFLATAAGFFLHYFLRDSVTKGLAYVGLIIMIIGLMVHFFNVVRLREEK